MAKEIFSEESCGQTNAYLLKKNASGEKMKKTLAILLGTLIASSAVLAQSNVLSRNAVGYIKVPVGTNKLHLVSNPFVPLDAGGDLLTNMFAGVYPGTTISVWNEGSQGYESYLRNTRGAWAGGAATVRVARADGVFIRSAGTGTVYFMGEVPDRFTAPTTTQSRAAGITMLGFPYPVEVQMTNTAMAIALSGGTTVSIWDDGAQGYNSYLKNTRGVWAAGAEAVFFKPGQAFVLRNTNAPQNWSQSKPYTWP